MNCPVCQNIALTMADRHGIEIDYCPKCRGVWLDRGELDKLIERGAEHQGTARQSVSHSDDRYAQHGYRRKSWLSDIFD